MRASSISESSLSHRSFSWYMKRLRVMQPGEVWARVGAQCGLAALSVRHRFGWAVPRGGRFDARGYRFCRAEAPLLPPWWAPDLAVDPDMAARVLTGGLPEPGWNWTWRPEAEVWHRAPDTGRLWPSRFCGFIPYRDGNPYGDVRRIWEPARLQQLVALGLLAAQRGGAEREQAVDLLERQFLSWMEANPPLTGVHYVSAMECGLRLIAVCHAVDLARPWLRRPERLWPAVVQLVEGHAAWVRRRVSLHSSLGNHTIAEAAALVYAGLLFPELPQANDWRAVGLSLLESEAAHQILPDGGGAEQGWGYLRFISDLYGLVRALAIHEGCPLPDAIEHAWARSRRFLAVVADSSGYLPSIGDGDNGYALSPVLVLPNQHRQEEGLTEFPESGYALVRTGEPRATVLIFDHGPLGMGPCFGHGHADALSVTLRSGTEDVLIDPGTFAYAGQPEWRAYFRGTSAHNTVVVDGLDQAVQDTPFQWSSPYRASLVSRQRTAGGGMLLIAVHDGYEQRAGVIHWRGVLCLPGLWVVADLLTGGGAHTLELNWHLGCRPVPDGIGYALSGQEGRFHVIVAGGPVRIVRGSLDPLLGWRSRSYGSKETADTLQAVYHGTLPHRFVTWIAAEEQDAARRREALSLLQGAMDEARSH